MAVWRRRLHALASLGASACRPPSLQVIAHELGHNLYMAHSGANVNNVFDE